MDTVKIEALKISKIVLSTMVSLLALGFGEYYELETLFLFGVVLSVICSISLLFVLIAYIIDFWRKKVCSKEK